MTAIAIHAFSRTQNGVLVSSTTHSYCAISDACNIPNLHNSRVNERYRTHIDIEILKKKKNDALIDVHTVQGNMQTCSCAHTKK